MVILCGSLSQTVDHGPIGHRQLLEIPLQVEHLGSQIIALVLVLVELVLKVLEELEFPGVLRVEGAPDGVFVEF